MRNCHNTWVHADISQTQIVKVIILRYWIHLMTTLLKKQKETAVWEIKAKQYNVAIEPRY